MTGFRVGQGIDFHRFDPMREMILGGVKLDVSYGLAGHSDADVLLHAVMDALLGAAGLGDIGMLFPDSDDRYRDADSTQLLEQVLRDVREAGLRPVNLDITMIGQQPKINPWRAAIRSNLARILGIPVNQVNLKATTTETMGALGRKEGLACSAVALVQDQETGT